MKRPLFLFSIALIGGIITAFLTGSYLAIIMSIFVLTFLIIIISFKYPDERLIIISTLIFYSIGAIEYLYLDNLNTNKFKEFSNQQVEINGYIDSEPDIREAKIMYVVKTHKIISTDITKNIDGKVILTTLKSNSGTIYRYGSNIKINGQLSLPKTSRNPGGFNYKKYLAQNGISANIFAKEDKIEIIPGEHSNYLETSGFLIRDRMISVINRSLPKEQAALLNGMLIGYTAQMDKEMQKDFSNAGLSHIMAVSGMNIAFIVFPMMFVLKKLRLKQKVSNIIIIITVIIFCFITGFSPSVLRAAIMAIIILIGQIMRREADVITSISFASTILLLYNPNSLFNIGFQLSFAATLSLILFYKTIRNHIDFKFIPKVLTDVLAATIAAQLGVLPMIALYFNKISLISIVANLLVVPLVEIVTILGFVMVIIGQLSILISQLIGYVNSTILTFILWVSKASSQIPYSVITVTTPPIVFILIYYIIVLFFFWYKPTFKFQVKYRYYFAALGLGTALIIITTLTPGNLEVVFIDVGEGDSSLIRTSTGKTVLIDGGGKSSKLYTDPNIGETIIIPFLLDYGVSKLDLVVATHAHDDHIGGLKPVLKDFPVENLILPYNSDNKGFNEILDISKTKNISTRFCRKGDIIRLDLKTTLKVLFPEQESTVNTTSLNNTSLVLKLLYKNTSLLFTGDIDGEVEKQLLEENSNLKADILKVAHHGSMYSTTDGFLEAVKPKAAIISVGKNTFGHPSTSVIERLDIKKIKLFRTDEDGAVIVSTDGERIEISKTVTE